MAKLSEPSTIDFDTLNPARQESILRIRQAVIDVALSTYLIMEVPEEVNRRKVYAGECLALIFGKRVTDDPVELLQRLGMSDEEIKHAGIPVSGSPEASVDTLV